MLNIMTKISWAIASTLILTTGFILTFDFKFIQFKFKKIIGSIFKKGNSSYDTLMLTLAGKIGVGSIAGVALAIYIGGPGTIVWLWVAAFLSMPLTFLETVLGGLYKEKHNNEYFGGPSYYIKNGLHRNILALVYSILIIISYTLGFMTVQVNTIVKSANNFVYIPSILIGIIVSILTFAIVIGGLKKINELTSKLVPFMTILYIILCIIIMFKNSTQILPIMSDIFTAAFTLKPFFSGFLVTFIIGMQRSIFSNEAGLGTGSIAASSSNSSDIVNDGYVQILGIYITSLVICTITSIIILMSPYQTLQLIDVNGIEIALFSFKYHFGSFGSVIMFIFVFMFSFSTIITGYYYSISSCIFIFKRMTPILNRMLIIVTMIIIILGSILSSTFLWRLVDFFVAALVIINVISMIQLKSDIKEELMLKNK